MPYDITSFDNDDSDKNAIVLAQTPFDKQSSNGLLDAGAIYRNQSGDIAKYLNLDATMDQIAAGDNQVVSPTVILFKTKDHFSSPNESFVEEQVFEVSTEDPINHEKRGYMVIKSVPDASGAVHYRSIEQSSRSIYVKDIIIKNGVVSGKNTTDFPI